MERCKLQKFCQWSLFLGRRWNVVSFRSIARRGRQASALPVVSVGRQWSVESFRSSASGDGVLYASEVLPVESICRQAVERYKRQKFC